MSRKSFGTLDIADAFLRAFFPPSCPHCHRLTREDPLCSHCKPLQPVLDPLCFKCGEAVSQAILECGRCLQTPIAHVSWIRSALSLTDSAKTWVHLIKFGRNHEYISLILRALPPVALPTSLPLTLIPVPMYPPTTLQRGFNQSEILCQWLVKALNLPVVYNGLRKIRRTAQQSTLLAKDRRSNLKNCFSWVHQDSAPARVLLVDDIFTTGSTLQECAKELLNSDAEEIGAWTLFRAMKT